MAELIQRIWSEDQAQDIAEYAVMLAVILVLVVGTLRLIGSNANTAFSSAASSDSITAAGLLIALAIGVPARHKYVCHLSRNTPALSWGADIAREQNTYCSIRFFCPGNNLAALQFLGLPRSFTLPFVRSSLLCPHETHLQMQEFALESLQNFPACAGFYGTTESAMIRPRTALLILTVASTLFCLVLWTACGGGGASMPQQGSPVANLSASTLTFASQAVATTSSPVTLTLDNSGTAPLNIAGISFANSNGEFAQTNDCGASLAAGANCSIRVTFTPTVWSAIPGQAVSTL